MITTIRNINENFFRNFYGAALGQKSLAIDVYGTPVNFRLNFARKSSVDFTETAPEQYPVISIQNYTPQPKDGWNNHKQKRYGALRDTDNDAVLDTISEMPLPIWVLCRFEISVACKKENEHTAAQEYFYRTFDWSNEASFLFNPVVVGDETLGDIVPYKLSVDESPREDGIFEHVYTFELDVPLQIAPSKDLTASATLEIVLNDARDENGFFPHPDFIEIVENVNL